MSGTDVTAYTRERPGMSAVALEDDVSTTPIPPIRAESMACGECISGSIARPKGRNETGLWWRRPRRVQTRAGSERVIVVV